MLIMQKDRESFRDWEVMSASVELSNECYAIEIDGQTIEYYGTLERAKEVLRSLLDALDMGETTFIMPEE